MLVNENQKTSSPNTFALNFKLDAYDGPLDLLLELIKEKKMDILTLNIADLSFQYLTFVNDHLNSLEIDSLSEYLIMASYLTELKSKMILPFINGGQMDGETELEIDTLRRQLFLYKQYKDVLGEFKICQNERVQYISKKCDDLDEYIPDELPEAPLPEQVSVSRLIRSWQKVLLQMKHEEVDKTFIINVNNIDVDEIENRLTEFISDKHFENIDFYSFVKQLDNKIQNIEYICAIFFALLSLSKTRIINLSQTSSNGPIFISKNNEIFEDAENDDVLTAIKIHQTISEALQNELRQKTDITKTPRKKSDNIDDVVIAEEDDDQLINAIDSIINQDDKIDEDEYDDDNENDFDEDDEDDISDDNE